MRAHCHWYFVALSALGCGGESRPSATVDVPPTTVQNHHARRVEGPTGVPIPATPLLGLFTVPVTVNGNSGPPMLVDTGAPVTYVRGASYNTGAADNNATTATLAFGTFRLVDVPIIGGDPFGLAPRVGGVLGANLICQFTSTWDWQQSRFFLGAPPADAMVTDEVVRQPFTLAGGGQLRLPNGTSVPVPATRLMVDVEVESRRLRMILDTGASVSAISDAMVAALTADGRGTATINVVAQGGTMQQRYFRVRRIGALGVSRDNALVVGYSAANLAVIAGEVGGQVDGLLGADFLRPWLTTIDYPRNEVVLRRYRDASHLRDPMTRVGILVGETAAGAAVIAQVLPGSNAEARGFLAGEVLTSVDGTAVAGMGRDAVDALMLGAAGQSRRIITDRRDADVRVEDLLPLP